MFKKALSVPSHLAKYAEKAKREGVKIHVGEYTFSCWENNIYLGGDVGMAGYEEEISFCHEWGHARLWMRGGSPIWKYFGPEGKCEYEEMDIQGKTAVLREEALAWKEAFVLREKEHPLHKRYMVDCYGSYLAAMSIPERDMRGWMMLLPI
jgi:hypothetical protein